jgi:hypothetical protein
LLLSMNIDLYLNCKIFLIIIMSKNLDVEDDGWIIDDYDKDDIDYNNLTTISKCSSTSDICIISEPEDSELIEHNGSFEIKAGYQNDENKNEEIINKTIDTNSDDLSQVI